MLIWVAVRVLLAVTSRVPPNTRMAVGPTVVSLVISSSEGLLASASTPTETGLLPVVRVKGAVAPTPISAVAAVPGSPLDHRLPVCQVPDVLAK